MLYGRMRGGALSNFRLIVSRKAHPVIKASLGGTKGLGIDNNTTLNDNLKFIAKNKKGMTVNLFLDLTKFRLSQYNTLAAYSMYLYYAPTFLPYESLIFLVATQLITMSSQAYNQTVEGDYDSKMRRTQNRPVAKGLINKQKGGLISASLALSSMAVYMQLANPSTLLVANTIWIGYCLVYTPMKRYSVHNTFVGAVIGALPPFIGT